ncbi:MAG: hypothetical protein ACXQTR_05520 [Candidatus Methanospirareceae archaeon]
MKIVRVKFWDHAAHGEVDLERRDSLMLDAVLTQAVGFVIHENEKRILISPWIAEGENSDVYAILKSDIVEIEELIPKSQVVKLLRKRRRGKR